MSSPQAHLLPDGRRLHLHHGPIDLIIEVRGAARDTAYARAVAAFDTVLDTLVTELPVLRNPSPAQFTGPVAQRMSHATGKLRPTTDFITPMAAVAGSVADHILDAMHLCDDTPKAYVNNGGDIALHLAPGHSLTLASPAGRMTLHHSDPTRGVATSGWSGRSHSLGIAEAVTVAAKTAAMADAAATLIANAVDLPDHSAIQRAPANSLSPDSDLGTQLVTTGVGALTQTDIAQALKNGETLARRYHSLGLIQDAALRLQDQTRTIQGTLEHA